jgi:hypothetical protein
MSAAMVNLVAKKSKYGSRVIVSFIQTKAKPHDAATTTRAIAARDDFFTSEVYLRLVPTAACLAIEGNTMPCIGQTLAQ